MSKGTPSDSVTVAPTQLFFPAEDPTGWENAIRLRNFEKGRPPAPNPSKQGFFVFKVRSTAPDYYHVRPRIGLLHPDSSLFVRFSAKAMPPEVLRDVRAGRGKHTFAIELRRVTHDRTFNQALTMLMDGSMDKKTVETLKELFDLSNEPVGTWTIATNFNHNRLQWIPSEAVNADGCTGVVVERNDSGAIAEYPANLTPPSATAAPSQPRSDVTDASPQEGQGASDPGLDRALRKLDEQIEDRRAEEARLRAELLALKNEAQQLQADCDAVLRRSAANEKRLSQLQQESRPAPRPAAAQLIAIPVPIMALLVMSTFIIAMAFRPVGQPHRNASNDP